MLGSKKIPKELKSILRKIQGQSGYYSNTDRYTTGDEFQELREIENLVENINKSLMCLKNNMNKKRRI